MLLCTSLAHAQDYDSAPVMDKTSWQKDSEYIATVAQDATSISFFPPVQVSVTPSKLYSHLEVRVLKYDGKILLTGQLVKHADKSFVTTLLMSANRYYKITFTDGREYTYHEPYGTPYADKQVLLVLKGKLHTRSKHKKDIAAADEALFAQMRKVPVKSIQPFEAAYDSETGIKGSYEPREKYILTADAGNQIMHALRSLEPLTGHQATPVRPYLLFYGSEAENNKHHSTADDPTAYAGPK